MPRLICLPLPFGAGGAGTNPHDDIKLPGEYVPSSYLWFLGNSTRLRVFLEDPPLSRPAIARKRSMVPGARPSGEPVFTPPKRGRDRDMTFTLGQGSSPFNVLPRAPTYACRCTRGCQLGSDRP